jgi:Zn-dependent metalloprotease
MRRSKAKARTIEYPSKECEVMMIKRIRLFIALGVLFALFGGLVGPGYAFIEDEARSMLEIELPQFDLTNHRSDAASQAGKNAAFNLEQTLGGQWRTVAWNPQTEKPHWMIASDAKVASALDSREAVEAAARQIIDSNNELFGVSMQDLTHKVTRQGLGKWAVSYEQSYEGVPVWQGGARMVFTETGKLFVLSADTYSDINLNPVPTLTDFDAERIAINDLPYDASLDYVEEAIDLIILPVQQSMTEVEHHLVWRLRVQIEDPRAIWVTHVDAHSGEIIWRYNDVHFVNFTGDAEGDIEQNTWCNGISVQPLPYMDLAISGLGGFTTNSSGEWTRTYGGTDSRTLTSTLTGPYVEVNNMSGPNAFFSGTATPGTPFTVDWDDTNAQRDERDCFEAVNEVHDFMSTFDPGYGYINQTMQCNVSINQSCNAYWDGTINFYTAGGGCANTGQVQGVVHHEFGHGVQHDIIGWQGDQGLGEGNSDVLANLITQESHIGRGFYAGNCSYGIRNSDNNLIYPDDVFGQSVHSAGRVIAGFHWDLLQELQDDYGVEAGTLIAAELWHFGRMLMLPTTQPDQVMAIFVADDTDGDLANGTPNFDAICLAASLHGFTCPEVYDGVIIDHTPLTDTLDEGEKEIIAAIWSTDGPIVSNTIKLNYAIDNGSFVMVDMDPTGVATQFAATIPYQAHSTHIEYYIEASDNSGNDGTLPPAAPAGVFEFDIARELDYMEADTGWTVNPDGTDDATLGNWIRAIPVASAAQPGEDHSEGLAFYCWVTANGPVGGDEGLADVDGGTTTLESTTYNLTGADEATLSYYRWYSNNISFNPNDDLWVVQARIDDGPWLDVENNQDNQNAWFHVESDLFALFGGELGELQLRFIASDLNGASVVEALVDDLKIMAKGAFSAAPIQPDDAIQFALHGSRVNPTPGATSISFQVPRSARVELDLFDLNGRKVRSLASETFTAGVHSVAWDGQDEGGRQVSSGVYYMRMKADEFSMTRKLVLSR